MKKTENILTASAVAAFLFALTLQSCGKECEYDASGVFEATDVTLSAETSGKILNFDVEEGDYIAAGDTVAVVDTVQLCYQLRRLFHSRAASDKTRPDISIQLAALQRELQKQEMERTRIENLLRDGAATSKQLDDIDAAIGVLRDRIAAQNSILSRNSSSIDESASAVEMEIKQTEQRIADCSITSPVSGTVLTKYCEAGEYAVPGKPLVRLADLGRMYLRAYFTSAQLADLSIGREVTVIADFGADRLFEYPGRIMWIASESEFTPKNIQTRDSRANLVYAVKIAVENDGRIKIGGYGNVKL